MPQRNFGYRNRIMPPYEMEAAYSAKQGGVEPRPYEASQETLLFLCLCY